MKTQVTITMDSEIKKDFQAFAKEIGTNMSTLLNMSAKEMTQSRRLDFDFSRMMTSELLESKKQAIKDVKSGTNMFSIKDL